MPLPVLLLTPVATLKCASVTAIFIFISTPYKVASAIERCGDAVAKSRMLWNSSCIAKFCMVANFSSPESADGPCGACTGAEPDAGCVASINPANACLSSSVA